MTQPSNIGFFHEDLSSIRSEQTDEMLQQHALAASASTDDRRQLAAGDLQVHTVEHRLLAKGLVHIDQPNDCRSSLRGVTERGVCSGLQAAAHSSTDVRK